MRCRRIPPRQILSQGAKVPSGPARVPAGYVQSLNLNYRSVQKSFSQYDCISASAVALARGSELSFLRQGTCCTTVQPCLTMFQPYVNDMKRAWKQPASALPHCLLMTPDTESPCHFFAAVLFLGILDEVPATEWQMFWNIPGLMLPEATRCPLMSFALLAFAVTQAEA